MGVERNIGSDVFPNQSNAIGSQVDVVRVSESGSQIEQGLVVRDDVADPFKGIIELSDGTVVLDTEREGFIESPQGSFVNKRVKTCFNYNTSNVLEGVIVRDDNEEPWVTVIKLDIGRFILATECQFQPY